jgi:hypothetical protein
MKTEELKQEFKNYWFRLADARLDEYGYADFIKDDDAEIKFDADLKSLITAAIAEHEAKLLIATTALDHIAHTIDYLRKEAEKEGGRLNRMVALELSQNANYLKEMAERALCELPKPYQPKKEEGK